MIKTVWILTFREDKDREEVSRWWRTDHGAIALRVPGIKRYVQNHFLEPLDADRAEGGIRSGKAWSSAGSTTRRPTRRRWRARNGPSSRRTARWVSR